jgi:RNA polymerase-associated protein
VQGFLFESGFIVRSIKMIVFGVSMAKVTSKRSVMTLYSNQECPFSHRVRHVLAEKGAAVEIIEVDINNKPEDLIDLNPYGQVPTLVDRDLVLYESRIIMEYLDERFPHPPLMPVYPVARAQNRLMLHRIDHDWYAQMAKIMSGSAAEVKKARKALQESLVSLEPVFAEKEYFLSEEFTLVDCSLGVLLWRLPRLGVEIPARSKALKAYCDPIFSRDAFEASLSDLEREYRD